MEMKDIEERLENIRLSVDDDEVAHMMEDSLFVEFVEYVATLNTPLALKAKKVLEVSDIDFCRWYA